ncbi:phosphoserine transaminase [Ravibacter arvi]|uniref:phosphoserine transaminase n=2 Tax=Ravibacter arvi TaxID=2051041 RepID=A0ABP8LQY6_9BACT
MQTYFTPGPAQLYPTFEKHLKTFVDRQLGSVSHRSQVYRELHAFTVSQLRSLLSVPDTHAILFLGSASEVWERILLSMVEKESFHLVNGSFSQKFYQYALAAGKKATKMEKAPGNGFDFDEITVPEEAELICTTHNETSCGVQMTETEIHRLKEAHPDKMIAVDMVSSAPYPALDYSLVDTAFFSVQKAFGLPAGLGVWIVGKQCLEKAILLKERKGLSIGAHHDLPTLWKNALNNETPATPNVMLIYLLGKIAADMNDKGVDTIRKETEKKAGLLYGFARANDAFSPFVLSEHHRSRTVAVLDTQLPAAEIIARLKERNLVIGSGYGDKKATQVRIANFPATDVAQIEALVSELAKI